MTNVITAFIQSIYVLLSGIFLALFDIVKAVINVFTQSILASYHIVQGIVGFLYSAFSLCLWVLLTPWPLLSAVLTGPDPLTSRLIACSQPVPPGCTWRRLLRLHHLHQPRWSDGPVDQEAVDERNVPSAGL